MPNHPNRSKVNVINAELLATARWFAQTVEYYILVDKKKGDDEGARLKSVTLHMIKETIAKAEARA